MISGKKDYSRLKWFLFIPWIGLGIIFFSVVAECRFRITKFWCGFMLALSIPAVIGTLIGELTFYLIAEELVYERLVRIIILMVFLHLGAFIWCCIVSKKEKKDQ